MVNTFVTTFPNDDPTFEKSARSLDRRRLGKQRVEAYQILNILNDLQAILDFGLTGYSGVTVSPLLISKIRKEYLANKPRLVYKENSGYELFIDLASAAASSGGGGGGRVVKLGFCNHPAVSMWCGYTTALKVYINSHIRVWSEKYKNTMKIYDVSNLELVQPWWRFSDAVVYSHRAALFRKEPESYPEFDVQNEYRDLGYCWPGLLETTVLTSQHCSEHLLTK